ncbi:MAG: MFS transporter [Streptosporangiaceae bacterium]
MRTRQPEVSRVASAGYRWYVAAQATSMVGTSMSYAALYWLGIHAAHGNALVLAVLVAAQFAPIPLLSGRAAAVLTRCRSARLVVTQAAQAAGALLIAIPMLAGREAVWYLCVVSCAIGCAQAFDVPGRQMFMLDLVGERELRRGVSLYSTILGLSKILGPAIAGGIIASAGEAPVFLINAVSFVFVICVLLRVARPAPPPGSSSAAGEAAAAGPVTARRFRWLLTLPRGVVAVIGMSLLMGGLAYQFEVTNPLMATDIFRLSPVGYGVIGALLAAGGIAGSYYSSRRGDPGDREYLLWSGLFGAAEIGAALAPGVWAYGAAMVVLGALLSLFTSSSLVFIQKATPAAQRPYAVSAYNAAFIGFVPAGAFLVTAIAATAGTRWSILIPGTAVAACAALARITPARISSPSESAAPAV